jgi:hypothetical protein
MVSSHWEHLSAVLRRHGVDAEAAALQQLPHDVVLTDLVRAQLA